MRLMIDTNIFLDVMAQRGPFFRHPLAVSAGITGIIVEEFVLYLERRLSQECGRANET